jgi:hypothetical protein
MQTKRLTIILLINLAISVYSCSSNDNSQKADKSKEQTDKKESYINNISAASLYDPLQKKGFKIDKQIGSDAIFVDCDRSTSGFSEHARIAGDDPDKILEIRASYTNYSAGKTNDLAKPFLGFVATLPYENSDPAKAREWVEKNISKNSKTEINGVSFEIFGNIKNIRTLLITPTK